MFSIDALQCYVVKIGEKIQINPYCVERAFREIGYNKLLEKIC